MRSKHLCLVLIVGAFVALASFALARQRGGGFSGGQGAAPAAWYGKSIALVVGIDQYSQGWPPLSAAVSDASQMETALRGQGFQVIKLLNQQATKDEILHQLQDVIPPQLGNGDRFLFYFSGHGQTEQAPGGQLGYLVPVNGRRPGGEDYWSSYISMKEIRNVLLDKYSAKHVLLVADACFSGLLAGRGTLRSPTVQAALRHEGRMVLTAGGRGEQAVDGLFTGVLVRGMLGDADYNHDGYITFSEGEMVFRCGDMGQGGGETPTPTPQPTPPPVVEQMPQPETAGGMVHLPGGTFWMGCSPGDSECDSDENPRHQVTLRPFWMDVTLVTQAEYQRAMGNNPSYFSGCADCPVEQVSWNDANNYCSRVGKRLPTEAEYEYAARGGIDSARYGDLDAIAWYSANSGGRTHPVGQKQPNAYGLYDMLGNAWEWCADWYDKNYYQSSPSNNPQGPSSGSSRVLRGDGWLGPPRNGRASIRGRGVPVARSNGLGVRCVRDRNNELTP
jgi:formylglycine-generating enzyme required for sulfatase activity